MVEAALVIGGILLLLVAALGVILFLGSRGVPDVGV